MIIRLGSIVTKVPEVLLVEKGEGLDPLSEKLLGNGLVFLPAGGGRAATHTLEVAQVSIDGEEDGAAVARKIAGPGADGDLVGGPDAVVGGIGGNPVLGGGMAEAEDRGRQARDGVGAVGNAVVATGLGADVVDEDGVADAGGAVGEDVDGLGQDPPEVGAGNGADGAAEGVAGDDDLVRGVAGQAAVDGGYDGGGDFFPGVLETGVHGAS